MINDDDLPSHETQQESEVISVNKLCPSNLEWFVEYVYNQVRNTEDDNEDEVVDINSYSQLRSYHVTQLKNNYPETYSQWLHQNDILHELQKLEYFHHERFAA